MLKDKHIQSTFLRRTNNRAVGQQRGYSSITHPPVHTTCEFPGGWFGPTATPLLRASLRISFRLFYSVKPIAETYTKLRSIAPQYAGFLIDTGGCCAGFNAESTTHGILSKIRSSIALYCKYRSQVVFFVVHGPFNHAASPHGQT